MARRPATTSPRPASWRPRTRRSPPSCPSWSGPLAAAEDTLRRLLVPRDPDDDRDVILEVKAGEGGEESALFAGDLLRMYLRYAERRGWSTEIIDATESDLGGYKDVRMAVKARGVPQPGDAPWARLKYEGGVHRVQRVPVTESQGRIHTSRRRRPRDARGRRGRGRPIDPNDLKIDVYRSSGPGGQSVNTTDSAVRITHLPTGTVVSCQNEKSQLQNKESAMRVLRARLHQIAQEAADQAASAARAVQIRTVDRSERIRTYNYPENRIADHRTGYKAYNLDTVLDGELDPLVQSAVDADEAARHDRAGAGLLGDVSGSLRDAVRAASRQLAAAGVEQADVDAVALAAHALRTSTGDVHRLMVLGADAPPGLEAWRRWWPSGPGACRCSTSPAGRRSATSSCRSARVSSCRGRRPRWWPASPSPLLRDLADAERRAPVVVDLCTGSGAIALA